MNALQHEKSPYLLQHAANPVDWLPWGEPALQKAKELGRPIFLSIGYATCHWCHVMEKESFEDEEVARILNELYVCVKVDREERPDIDSAYMTVCQLMNGHGGWPLTVVMNADKEPFFAATYIPKYTRGEHRPGLIDLLPLIHRTWKEDPDRIRSIISQVRSGVESVNRITPDATADVRMDELCLQHLTEAFDPTFGGFGQAPKFPTPQNLLFLLDYAIHRETAPAEKLVKKTLNKMREGGIFDHVGFGFHRYATDRAWKVPHFEKMLYDQAFLLLAYAKAYAYLRNPLYLQTGMEIHEYVTTRLISPDGLFHSAEDADSEGEEGRFYTWKHAEIRSLFSITESALLEEVYSFRPEGNYLEEHSGYPNGTNILHQSGSLNSIADQLGMERDSLRSLLEDLRIRLLEYRSARVPPLLDDKVLTDWNGYMVYAIAKASVYLDQPEWAEQAQNSLRCLLKTMMDGGTLYHRHREGERAIKAFAHDYVACALAAYGLFESTQNVDWLDTCLELLNLTEERFADPVEGGLFTTSVDGEPLLGRHKEVIDTAIPCLNSLYAWLLLKLFRITGGPSYRTRLDSCFHLVGPLVRTSPGIAPFLARAFTLEHHHTYEIVLTGPEDDPVLFQMKEVCNRFSYRENTLLVITEHNRDRIASLCPYTSQMSVSKTPLAYVCRGHHCERPVSDPGDLYHMLST